MTARLTGWQWGQLIVGGLMTAAVGILSTLVVIATDGKWPTDTQWLVMAASGGLLFFRYIQARVEEPPIRHEVPPGTKG